MTKEQKLCLGIGAGMFAVLLIVMLTLVIPKNTVENGQYRHFEPTDTYVTVLESPAWDGHGRFLIPQSTDFGRAAAGVWSSNEDLREALNLMVDQVNVGIPVFYDYYSEEEMARDNTKADATIGFIKGDPGAPAVILLGGGGNQDVAFLAEALSSGTPFHNAGYNVFSIKYRAEMGEVVPGQPNGVTAVQDVKAAMTYIFNNAGKFEIDPEKYAIGGFSAGSSNARNFVNANGNERYAACDLSIVTLANGSKLPTPDLMILIYGANANDATENSPTTFTVAAQGDEGFSRSVAQFHKAATEAGKNHYAYVGEGGWHGFGRGTGLSVEGWGEKCVEFWETGSVADWPGNVVETIDTNGEVIADRLEGR